MGRPHHSQKKRRSKERRDRDAYRQTHREPRNEEALYWRTRLDKRPLLRYKTPILEGDVIKLIQGMETLDLSRRVVFHQNPIQMGDGFRYNFHVQYQKIANPHESVQPKWWVKTDQIYGAVISGPHYTTIEFRTTMTTWQQPLSLIVLGGLVIAFLVLIASGDLPVTCFNLAAIVCLIPIGLYTAYLNYTTHHPTHDQGMEAVLKRLKAVKIEEPAEKTKHIDSSKHKIEEA